MLEYLTSAVVKRPDKIEIEQIETQEIDIFYVRVSKEDMGRVLGKGGKTADSIRDVMQAGAKQVNKEVIIDVVE